MNVELPVGGATMGAFVADPTEPNGVGVVVLMEAFGLNDHIRDVCRRLAVEGYVALAPDLYHRQGERLTAPYDEPERIMPAFANLDVDEMTADLTAAVGELTARAGVPAARVGALGFCLGGYAAFLAACRTAVGAAACFYGAGIGAERDGPLVPLLDEVGAIEGTVVAFYGADDPHIPPEEIEAVRRALSELRGGHDTVVYDGAGHGFFCDERAAHRPEAATDAWQRVLALLDQLRPKEGSEDRP